MNREGSSLSIITNEIDAVIGELTDSPTLPVHTKDQEKCLENKSHGLYKLSQQEIEDLILMEHNNTKTIQNVTKPSSDDLIESSLTDPLLATEWDIHIYDKAESWTDLEETNELRVSSTRLLQVIVSPDIPSRNGVEPDKSSIYYDNGDVELLKSIEKSFSVCKQHTFSDDLIATSRLSNSTVDSVAQKI